MVPRLEVRGAARRFGGVAALDGVDLTLAPGECLGLVGPNGSGKTTLLNVISGVYPLDAGSVLLDGAPVSGLSADRIARRGVVRTFQNARLFPRLSVAENVRAALHSRASLAETLWTGRAARRRERERVRHLLALLTLEAVAEALPDRLSLAERRRVELARALATEPRVLLLDEPASGMTRDETDALLPVLADHVLPGRATILIEHKLAVVTALCSRATVLAAGTVLADGPPGAVLSSREVRRVYLGEVA